MTVAIIDYGSGNLRSAAKAFGRASESAGTGAEIIVTNRPEDLDRASHIVLPGVGAFGDCMAGLTALDGMRDSLERNVIDDGKPFLGICVGMQLMAERGVEHGIHTGFGWIQGEITPIQPSDDTLKIPHMGWNDLDIIRPEHPVFRGISSGTHTYFVHGYALSGGSPDQLLARVDYAGDIVAVVGRDNLVGTQFHPEKSQKTGLKFIENFLGWKP
jgi:imidazole glycerol-phosphate synthase subunit HisH